MRSKSVGQSPIGKIEGKTAKATQVEEVEGALWWIRRSKLQKGDNTT